MAGVAAGLIFGVVLSVPGLLSLPTEIKNLAQPDPQKIMVNIGVGASDSSVPTDTLGGNAPLALVFDVNGNLIGPEIDELVPSPGNIVEGGAAQQQILSQGQIPEYIKLIASGSDAVCVSWFSTTSSPSSNQDFRTYNGGNALPCGVPWYPSTSQFPTLSTQYQPPCIWMSNDGRFLGGFSAKLFDFSFPEPQGANSSSQQWTLHPDTLCSAPARQLFYKSVSSDLGCIPIYPSGLSLTKDPDTGFDSDFTLIKVDQIKNTEGCDLGTLFGNEQALDGPADPHNVMRPVSGSADTTLTTKRGAESKRFVLNRRVEARTVNPHEWCEENTLVISSFVGHSAMEVCESTTSWGADFVSVIESVYCDMCERKAYPLCSEGGSDDSGNMTIVAKPTTLIRAQKAGPIGNQQQPGDASPTASSNWTTISTASHSRTTVTPSMMVYKMGSNTYTVDPSVYSIDMALYSNIEAQTEAPATTTGKPTTDSSITITRSLGDGSSGTCFDMQAKQLRVHAQDRRRVTKPARPYHVIKRWNPTQN